MDFGRLEANAHELHSAVEAIASRGLSSSSALEFLREIFDHVFQVLDHRAKRDFFFLGAVNFHALALKVLPWGAGSRAGA